MTATDNPRCEAPVGVARDGGVQECGAPAWRTYLDVHGNQRAFCVLAMHAWMTVGRYAAQPGSQEHSRRVAA